MPAFERGGGRGLPAGVDYFWRALKRGLDLQIT
jgi:hypothetical protein